jgi:hypothetical protein
MFSLVFCTHPIFSLRNFLVPEAGQNLTHPRISSEYSQRKKQPRGKWMSPRPDDRLRSQELHRSILIPVDTETTGTEKTRLFDVVVAKSAFPEATASRFMVMNTYEKTYLQDL